MRWTCLATVMLCVAASAAAQSHEAAQPAAKTVAGRSAPVVSRITVAPKPTVATADQGAVAGSHAPAAKAARKPVVSGARAAGGHGAEAPTGPRVSGVRAPKATPTTAHGAPATHDEHASAAEPIAAPAPLVSRTAANAKTPVQLSTVHGRITAALAELRAESGGETKDAGDGHATARGAAKGHMSPATKPRYVVAWPGVRWRVAWPDDLDRLTVSWPE
ncbi:MAG TPA: hypothetical protein VMW48_08915 [Vicinamibacterales bacterium]|nr:hypothetical protein [Vicinamibacterales bacterium]